MAGAGGSTHIVDQGFPYQHPKDVGEGDGLPRALLAPQGVDVALHLLRGEQQQRAVAHRPHQLLVDLPGALGWEIRVGIQRGHVPATAKGLSAPNLPPESYRELRNELIKSG